MTTPDDVDIDGLFSGVPGSLDPGPAPELIARMSGEPARPQADRDWIEPTPDDRLDTRQWSAPARPPEQYPMAPVKPAEVVVASGDAGEGAGLADSLLVDAQTADDWIAANIVSTSPPERRPKWPVVVAALTAIAVVCAALWWFRAPGGEQPVAQRAAVDLTAVTELARPDGALASQVGAQQWQVPVQPGSVTLWTRLGLIVIDQSLVSVLDPDSGLVRAHFDAAGPVEAYYETHSGDDEIVALITAGHIHAIDASGHVTSVTLNGQTVSAAGWGLLIVGSDGSLSTLDLSVADGSGLRELPDPPEGSVAVAVSADHLVAADSAGAVHQVGFDSDVKTVELEPPTPDATVGRWAGVAADKGFVVWAVPGAEPILAVHQLLSGAIASATTISQSIAVSGKFRRGVGGHFAALGGVFVDLADGSMTAYDDTTVSVTAVLGTIMAVTIDGQAALTDGREVFEADPDFLGADENGVLMRHGDVVTSYAPH